MSKRVVCSSSSASSLVASSSAFAHESTGRFPNGPDLDPSCLWPSFYLERPDGTCTALIEVDLLPELIRIRGLPPKFSVSDTAGMTSVGTKDGGLKRYIVEIADNSANFYLRGPTKHTNFENSSTITNTTTSSSKAPPDAMIVFDVSDAPIIAEAPPSKPARPEEQVKTFKPTPRKGEKVYCTHWITKGECSFSQQGCKFKHEMPDLETLCHITGKLSYPKWWFESKARMQRNAPAPAPDSRPALTNRQGKRRANAAEPPSLPALNMTTSSSSSILGNPKVAVQAPIDKFPSLVKSPIVHGSSFAPTRMDGGIDIRSHDLGPSGGSSSMIQTRQPVQNIRSPLPGSGGNSVLQTRQSVSNTGSPAASPSRNNIRSPVSGQSGNGSIIRSPIPGPSGTKMIQTNKQLMNNDSFTIYTPRSDNATSSSRLSITTYNLPKLRNPINPTISSSSSATGTKPRVKLPREDISGVKAEKKKSGPEIGTGQNEGAATYNSSDSNQTTRPYGEVFDLLGPL